MVVFPNVCNKQAKCLHHETFPVSPTELIRILETFHKQEQGFVCIHRLGREAV